MFALSDERPLHPGRLRGRMRKAEADEIFKKSYGFKTLVLPMLHLLVTRTETHPA